jgi:hypothetical protein
MRNAKSVKIAVYKASIRNFAAVHRQHCAVAVDRDKSDKAKRWCGTWRLMK